MDVGRLREQIPSCQRMIYMNTGWSGPSPTSVVEAIERRLEYENDEGPTSPPVLDSGRELQQRARESVASLLNVSPQEICVTQNTTDGLNTVLNGLPWQESDELITFGLEHSSVLIPAYYLQHRRGVRIKVLPLEPAEEADSIVQKVEAAITDRTRLVFCSHIQYTCGLRMPVAAIRKVTRARGVRMLLDGAQTAGHIVLDLRALDSDWEPGVYAVPAQKWLLGPEGVGALYIRQDLIPMVQPVRVSGRAAISYDDQGHFEANDSSMDKFLLTTKSAPLCAGFAETVRFVQEIGVEAIERRVLSLAHQLKSALSEIPGVTVVSPVGEALSSGLTSFQIKGVQPDVVVTRLWKDHRIVARAVKELSAVRISTHFFNTEDELSRLAEAVQRLAG